MDHRDWHDFWKSSGCQFKPAHAGQFYRQGLQEKFGQLFAQAVPYSATKWQVMEPAIFVFCTILSKAIGVKDINILEDWSGVVRVSDAVQNAPSFWNLEAIQLKGLQDGPVAPWDGTEESQQLLNDAVEVVETADGIHA